jgi:hypothetical protein
MAICEIGTPRVQRKLRSIRRDYQSMLRLMHPDERFYHIRCSNSRMIFVESDSLSEEGVRAIQEAKTDETYETVMREKKTQLFICSQCYNIPRVQLHCAEVDKCNMVSILQSTRKSMIESVEPIRETLGGAYSCCCFLH